MKTRMMTYTVCGAALAMALTMASAEAGMARRLSDARSASMSTSSVAPRYYTDRDPIRYVEDPAQPLSSGQYPWLYQVQAVVLSMLMAPLR